MAIRLHNYRHLDAVGISKIAVAMGFFSIIVAIILKHSENFEMCALD